MDANAGPRYRLAPRISFQIPSAETALVKLGESDLRIPLDHLQLLLHFAEPHTIAEVYTLVIDSIDFEAFTKLVLDLVRKALLVEDVEKNSAPLLLDYLDEKYRHEETWRALSSHITAGRCVVLRDAFVPSFAEKIFGCLERFDRWRPYEDYTQDDFSYHHHNIYDRSQFPDELVECERIFASPVTRDFMERLCNRECRGKLQLGASRFLPGDYQLPHPDDNRQRNVSFIWHLTKNWQPKWGGGLYWCPSLTTIPPSFNTLVLFNPSPRSIHFVTAVSPFAEGKRLTVNGWWTASAADLVGKDLVPSPATAPATQIALPPSITVL